MPIQINFTPFLSPIFEPATCSPEIVRFWVEKWLFLKRIAQLLNQRWAPDSALKSETGNLQCWSPFLGIITWLCSPLIAPSLIKLYRRNVKTTEHANKTNANRQNLVIKNSFSQTEFSAWWSPTVSALHSSDRWVVSRLYDFWRTMMTIVDFSSWYPSFSLLTSIHRPAECGGEPFEIIAVYGL